MEVILKGKLIDVDFDNWEFEDKKGTRYFGTLKDENKKLIQFKIDEKEFDKFQAMNGEYIEIVCSIYVNGRYTLTFKEM